MLLYLPPAAGGFAPNFAGVDLNRRKADDFPRRPCADSGRLPSSGTNMFNVAALL
jgi:hypothetical protein